MPRDRGVTPLWLLGVMGYTATQAGYVAAPSGVLCMAVVTVAAPAQCGARPAQARLAGRDVDGRSHLVRSFATPDTGLGDVGLPLMSMGLGMPFFLPLTGQVPASVRQCETASAAGVTSFSLTVSGAFATSLVNTGWEDGAMRMRTELVGLLNRSVELAA